MVGTALPGDRIAGAMDQIGLTPPCAPVADPPGAIATGGEGALRVTVRIAGEGVVFGVHSATTGRRRYPKLGWRQSIRDGRSGQSLHGRRLEAKAGQHLFIDIQVGLKGSVLKAKNQVLLSKLSAVMPRRLFIVCGGCSDLSPGQLSGYCGEFTRLRDHRVCGNWGRITRQPL